MYLFDDEDCRSKGIPNARAGFTNAMRINSNMKARKSPNNVGQITSGDAMGIYFILYVNAGSLWWMSGVCVADK